MARNCRGKGAPAMIVVSIDASKAVPGCETVDPIIALSYAELYADSLGLGTLWDDFATKMLKKYPEARAILEIPDGYEISFVLLLGEPAVKYNRTVQKESKNVTVI